MCSLSRLADYTNMRLNNKVFDGPSGYFDDNQALQPVAGLQNWFGEFNLLTLRA
jgi:hypothetical protein